MGRRSWSLAAILLILVLLLSGCGLLDQAKDSLQSAVESIRQAEDLSASGSYEKALELYEKALSAYEKYKSEDKFRIGKICDDIGRLYVKLDRAKEAVPYFRRAVEILKEALGPDHPDTQAAQENLSAAEAAAGE